MSSQAMQHIEPAWYVNPRDSTQAYRMQKRTLILSKHGKQFQQKHLETRKKAAKDVADVEAFQKICAIIQQEQQRDFW